MFNVLQDEELKGSSVLVYANKQDLPNSMDTSEVVERIGMHNMRGRDWHVQSCTATTGDGLWEGLDWLNDTLQSKRYAFSCLFTVPNKTDHNLSSIVYKNQYLYKYTNTFTATILWFISLLLHLFSSCRKMQ